jgi:hypothetical protein
MYQFPKSVGAKFITNMVKKITKKKHPHRQLWADCLDNVGASTSHNPMGLEGLLQGYCYLFFFFFYKLAYTTGTLETVNAISEFILITSGAATKWQSVVV